MGAEIGILYSPGHPFVYNKKDPGYFVTGIFFIASSFYTNVRTPSAITEENTPGL